jgi:hypothetical protein
MNGTPKFSERLWEWRLFSNTLNKSLLNVIQGLPVKFDRPTKMTDKYVRTPDCNLNIKLREQDLKIKELIGFQPCEMDNALGTTTYAEQWTIEVYSFPIPTLLMKRIGKGLGIKNLPRSLPLVENKKQFIESLQSHSNSVRILSIFKQREQHLLPIENDPKDKCVIHRTFLYRYGIGCIMRDVDKQIYRSMIFMNYLQAVKIWGLGKKIFG